MSNYMFYMLVPSPVQCSVHHCSATFTIEQCDFPSVHSLEPVDDLHFKTLAILNAHIDTDSPVSMVINTEKDFWEKGCQHVTGIFIRQHKTCTHFQGKSPSQARNRQIKNTPSNDNK